MEYTIDEYNCVPPLRKTDSCDPTTRLTKYKTTVQRVENELPATLSKIRRKKKKDSSRKQSRNDIDETRCLLDLENPA